MRKAIGTVKGRVRVSTGELVWTSALSMSAHGTGIMIPKHAVVKSVKFAPSAAGGTADEAVTIGWAASNVLASAPGTQTGIVDEVADADGLGSLTNTQWTGAGAVRIEAPYALANKRFSQSVEVTITPDKETAARTTGTVLFEIEYVIS